MNTSEVLDRAADLIEERGWAVGNRGLNVNGPYCLEGALYAAGGSKDTFVWGCEPLAPNDSAKGDKMFSYLREEDCPTLAAVTAYLAQPEGRVWEWNDSRGSADEVIETLRACAVIEAARESAPRNAEVTAQVRAL